MSATHSVGGEVIRLDDRFPREPEHSAPRSPPGVGRRVATCLLFASIVLSALAGGLYDEQLWAPVGVGVLAAAGLTIILVRVKLSRTAAVVLGSLVALLVLSALSMLSADSVDRAWTETNRVALYAGFFFVAAQLLRSVDAARAALVTIAATVGVLAAGTAGAIASGRTDLFLDGRLNAPLDYINGSASLLLMGAWPALALAVRSPRISVASVGFGLAVLEINLVVLTQSRAVVPAVLASVLVVLLVSRSRVAVFWTLIALGAAVAAALPVTAEVYRTRVLDGVVDVDAARAAGAAALLSAVGCAFAWGMIRLALRGIAEVPLRRVATVGAVVAAVVAGAGALAVIGNPVDRINKSFTAFKAVDVAVESTENRFTSVGGYRYDLWRVAYRQWQEEPLLGVGAGSYGLRYFSLRNNPDSVRQPHNLPLQLLAELGIGGALALLALLAGGIAAIARTARRSDGLAIGFGGLVVAWGTHSSLDWLWNIPTVTTLALGALAGLAASVSDPRASSPRRSGVHSASQRIVVVAVLITATFAAASMTRLWMAGAERERAATALSTDPAAALRYTRRALELNPVEVDTRYIRAAAFARFGDYSAARKTLLQAVDAEPRNFVPQALLGDLATRRGELTEARRRYRAASSLNPLDQPLSTLAAQKPGEP